jgi:hypothetical protein
MLIIALTPPQRSPSQPSSSLPVSQQKCGHVEMNPAGWLRSRLYRLRRKSQYAPSILTGPEKLGADQFMIHARSWSTDIPTRT